MSELIATLVVLTLIKATPIIYAALGGVISERSGVINIGLEGMMAAGAFFAVVASFATHSPLVGLLAGNGRGRLLRLSARSRGDALQSRSDRCRYRHQLDLRRRRGLRPGGHFQPAGR